MAKRNPEDGLTDKQRRFCAEYMVDRNATKAAIRAGFSAATAAQIAYQLFQKPSVQGEVKRLEDAAMKRLHVSADKVLAEWANLGWSDPGSLVWRIGEKDSMDREVHEEEAACENDCKRPHAGAIKPLGEMPPEVRRTIRSIKFDSEGRPEFSFWDKSAFHGYLGKFHKLVTDRVELTGKVSLADRVKEARRRAGQIKK